MNKCNKNVDGKNTFYVKCVTKLKKYALKVQQIQNMHLYGK